MQSSELRVNIGCGPSPTPGWLNFDNSLSVRLAGHPLITSMLRRLGILNEKNLEVISATQSLGVRWADAARHIPIPDESAVVLYTSHMLEHLDRKSVERFLSEVHRVLVPGGIIRISVPDLRQMVDNYLREGDADEFIEKTLLAKPAPTGFLERVQYLVVGDRYHKWMYDEKSICRLLLTYGFRRPLALTAGATTIAKPGELDLFERSNNSIYIEAMK